MKNTKRKKAAEKKTGSGHTLRDENKLLRKRVAELEEKSALGEMAGQIAHEINNLVSLLLAYTQNARSSNNASQIKRAFDVVIDVSAKLLHLSGSIREYIEGTSVAYSIDSPVAALENVIKLMEVPLKKANIAIKKDFRSYSCLACDVRQLELVFINLINNAKEALLKKEENREIAFSAWQNEKHLYIEVKDNGIGMTQKVKESAFKPFFTTKRTTHKKAGIGLTVCRDIVVKRHLGKLRFASEHKKGTTFTIVLNRNFDLEPKAMTTDRTPSSR